MSESDSQRKNSQVNVVRRNRVQLVSILVIAVLSLGGSYLLYFMARDGSLWGTTNQGEWVNPAVQVSELPLIDAGTGQPVVHEALWGLWVVATDGCNTVCADAVFRMRQLHVLLNNDADRLRRALIAPDAGSARLPEAFPKLALWRLDSPASLASGIYIVDPLGNLVFRYPLASEGKPVLTDVKRLLRVSQIG